MSDNKPRQTKITELFKLPSQPGNRTGSSSSTQQKENSNETLKRKYENSEELVEKKMRTIEEEPVQVQDQAQKDVDDDDFFYESESFEKALQELVELEALHESEEALKQHPYFGGSFLKEETHCLSKDLPGDVQNGANRNNEENCDQTWDSNHVKLPCARKNCYKDNQTQKLVHKWIPLVNAFSTEILSIEHLRIAILQYNQSYYEAWNFSGFNYFCKEIMDSAETKIFFQKTLKGIINLCLMLPKLFNEPIPLLSRGKAASITLSQHQIASLLANAFLCTFPRRNALKQGSEYSDYPTINFNSLYEGDRGKCSSKTAAKMRCLLHYFERVLETTPTGNVTFERRVLDRFPRWKYCDKKLIPAIVKLTGSIEDDGIGMSQVDFANKRIGGGVLGWGAVQEEIRFMICPELIVSRLFSEQMDHNESIIITGAERFSNYDGYADTFTWRSDHRDNVPIDSFGRRETEIIAIDALKFHKSWEQYSESALKRELHKAFAGFWSPDSEPKKIATGLWGCGVFGGDPQLKYLIQIIVSSVCNRGIVFFTYGNETLFKQIQEINSILDQTSSLTAGKLYQYLEEYCTRINSNKEEDQDFNFDLFTYCSNQIKKDFETN